MTDLETAAAPSKSVNTIIQCPSEKPIPRSSSHAKTETPIVQSSTNQNQTYPSTQLYVRPQDDPLPTPTMDHAITTQNTLTAHSIYQISQTTTAKSQNIGAIINVIGYNDPPDASHNTTTQTHDGISTPSQVIWPHCNLSPDPATPATNTIPQTSPDQPTELDTTFQIISAQLNYIETYLRALHSGAQPPPVPTALLNIKPRKIHAPLHTQHDRSDTMTKPHTTLDGIDHIPCHPNNSHHDSQDAARGGPESQSQSIAHELDQQSAPFVSLTPTIESIADPTSTRGMPHYLTHTCHVPNLAMISMVAHQDTANKNIPPVPTNPAHTMPVNRHACYSLDTHNPHTPSPRLATSPHSFLKSDPPRPTFQQWCQDNDTLTRQTSRLPNYQTAALPQDLLRNKETLHESTSFDETTHRIHDTEFEKFTLRPTTQNEAHFLPAVHLYQTTPSIHQRLIIKALGRRHVRFRRMHTAAGSFTHLQVLQALPEHHSRPKPPKNPRTHPTISHAPASFRLTHTHLHRTPVAYAQYQKDMLRPP